MHADQWQFWRGGGRLIAVQVVTKGFDPLFPPRGDRQTANKGFKPLQNLHSQKGTVSRDSVASINSACIHDFRALHNCFANDCMLAKKKGRFNLILRVSLYAQTSASVMLTLYYQ